MNKPELSFELYRFFRSYVDNPDIKNYDDFFLKRKQKDETHIKNLLSKYIDLENCCLNPKRKHDILMINYALIELPTVGLIYSKLFKDYLRKNKQYLKKNR